MNAFFLKLSEFRKSCASNEEVASFVREASRLYLLLMATKEEISSEQLAEILTFKKNVPSDQEDLFHHLWFLNALARYYCFILKDLEEASKLTFEAIEKSELLFHRNFKENNQEKRSFIFILAVNVIRLSFYKEEYDLCEQQLNEFRFFLSQGTASHLPAFPSRLQSLFDRYGTMLSSRMTEEDFSYFEGKLNIVQEKLNLRANNLLQNCFSHFQNKSNQIAFYDYDKEKSYTWKDVENISCGIADLIKSVVSSKEKYVFLATQQNILFPSTLIAAWETKKTPIMIHENYTLHELAQIKNNLNESACVLVLDEHFDEKVIDKFKHAFEKIIFIAEKDLHSQREERSEKISVKQDDFALGLLTSGSSGPPKICLFTHDNLFRSAQIEMANDPLFEKGYIANLRPHYTSAGLNSLWPSLLSGNKNLFSEKIRKTPISRFLNELLSKEHLSMLILSPTYILSLFRSSDITPLNENPLPLYFGGSSLPWSVLKKLLENNFLPSMRYGMTEVAHIVSKVNYYLDQDHYKKEDVGIPFTNFEVACVEDYVQIKSPGTVSLIIDEGVKHLLPKEHAYLTADKACFDERGSLQLSGRDNQTICINGFRFNTQQVEEVLIQSSAVVDCRTLSITNQGNSEQKLIAYLLVKDGMNKNFIENELRNLVKEKLSPFKWPSLYFFLQEWPMMPNGKIDFNKLKELI